MSVSREEVQEAVVELHQYLSDQKPPLMVAEAVGLLLRCPPHYLAAQIHVWVSGQVLTAPVADYLYHGAKKISLMGDLDLLPKEALARRLPQLTDALVQYAPESDREILREHLTRLGQAGQAATLAAPGVIYHHTDSSPALATPGGKSQRLDPDVRRLALLLDHLRPLASAAAPPERRTELASQFMTTAAAQASSIEELDRHLAPLRELGIDTGSEQVFRTLARSLAGWLLPRVVIQGQPAPMVSRQQLDAMSRIVSLGTDPAEVAKRFREMVHAAIEQFNEGHLGRAAAMFELAERLAAEEKVKPMFVDPLRSQGHEYLNPDRLRKFAERLDCRMALRFVLHFFTALTTEGLLKALNGEPQRERRHHLLALLEAHEGAARAAAWELLKASVEPGAGCDPFFQMNLVYLLRIIPRPPEASVEEEIDVVTRSSDRSSPPPLIKQIIAYLAQTRQESAERVLAGYLRVFESMLLNPETAAYSAEDLEVLLDRTCAALARYGTPGAWGLLVDHGLKSEARLGSPFVRLAEAGRFDLSGSRDLVERIMAAARAELPRGGLLGDIVGSRKEEKAVSLVQALASTPLPEVRALLQEIAAKYPGRMIGQAAAKTLASLGSAPKPPAGPAAGLSGDLELFGLPNLMQTLAQSSLTGILSILDAQGRTRATVLFQKGQFRGGQCGPVLGDEAIYQLFEKPFPGSFAFVSRDIESQPRVGPPADVIGLLLEGARRYDEFRRAAAVVPDGARLKPAGKPHGVPADEDPDLATMVWKAVTSGEAIEECEATLTIDSYRVRRLTAHWVEEGSLQSA